MLTKILFAALLAPSLAITPRRRALRRVNVPKATKKQKNAAPIEDVGFAHRYFSTAIDDSRFFFRALAVRGGGEEKPLVTPAQVLRDAIAGDPRDDFGRTHGRLAAGALHRLPRIYALPYASHV